LLINDINKSPRANLFKKTLESLGYDVVTPDFKTRNWLKISQRLVPLIKETNPDVIHLFNVPDILYGSVPSVKGKYYQTLIYDYRSPWGVALDITFKVPFLKQFGEYYERKLVRNADIITTANSRLSEKILPWSSKDIYAIPNYPSIEFLKSDNKFNIKKDKDKKIILFLGAVSRWHGSNILARIILNLKKNLNILFWVLGDGPDLPKIKRKLRNCNNAKFFGRQSHNLIPGFIKAADILVHPEPDSAAEYVTDESVLAINEFLNIGKKVIASGISQKEKRKNLTIVPNRLLEETILVEIEKPAEKLKKKDYRLWETHCKKIVKDIYENKLYLK